MGQAGLLTCLVLVWLNLNICTFRSFLFLLPTFVHTNLTRRIDPRYPQTPISKNWLSCWLVRYRYFQPFSLIVWFCQRDIWKTENPIKTKNTVTQFGAGWSDSQAEISVLDPFREGNGITKNSSFWVLGGVWETPGVPDGTWRENVPKTL